MQGKDRMARGLLEGTGLSPGGHVLHFNQWSPEVSKLPEVPPQIHTGINSRGLPRWLSGKESACQAGDSGWIPELGRSSGEKEMATYSSILAWEIPWTEEPGRLHTVYGVAKELDTT